jgi:hypothetical protein
MPKFNIKIGKKQHEVFIQKSSDKQNPDDVVFVECRAANIKQKFLKEDLADLLIDLPNLIEKNT